MELDIFHGNKKEKIIVIISIIPALLMFVMNFIYFRETTTIFAMLNVLGASMILGPFLVIKYREYKRKKEIENRFPDFLRDVAEAVGSGMNLPKAIISTKDNDYGPLSPHVRKMVAQVDWGIKFETILTKFADEIGSGLLRRTTSTIVEAHSSGGNIQDTLKNVSNTSLEIEKLKKERSSQIFSQMITGYMIFFIFLGVMIGLQLFLIPSLSFQEEAQVEGMELGGGGLGQEGSKQLYSEMFQWLIIIQGAFSGIAIGKMAEGSVLGGIRHSVILVAIGYSLFVLAQPILGGFQLGILPS